MTLVTSSLIALLVCRNFIISHVTNVSSTFAWSSLYVMSATLSFVMSFSISVVTILLTRRSLLLFLAYLFSISLVIFIIISKTILSKRLYYLLLTFVSNITLFSFVIGYSFVIINRIMDLCRVMWNIAQLIILFVAFITFVTLFALISTKIFIVLLISITLLVLKVLFISIGCAGLSI